MSTHVGSGDALAVNRPLTPELDGSRANSDETLRRLNATLERQVKRIAQELHSEAGQLLTSAHITLSTISEDVPPHVRERLIEVKAHLDAIEDQLRRICHELRPRILDDLGLVAALEFLAEGVRKRRGLTVTVNAAFTYGLPVVVETAVYRIVQEAVNNATKHAHAHAILIGIEHVDAALRCTIEDDGIGFDRAALATRSGERGLGLAGIQEQVEMLGGTFQIESRPGGGTRLIIALDVDV
jgi:signal transduction histidine kinase